MGQLKKEIYVWVMQKCSQAVSQLQSKWLTRAMSKRKSPGGQSRIFSMSSRWGAKSWSDSGGSLQPDKCGSDLKALLSVTKCESCICSWQRWRTNQNVLPFIEKQSRLDAQPKKLPGLPLTAEQQPSHSLIDAVCNIVESGNIVHVHQANVNTERMKCRLSQETNRKR